MERARPSQVSRSFADLYAAAQVKTRGTLWERLSRKEVDPRIPPRNVLLHPRALYRVPASSDTVPFPSNHILRNVGVRVQDVGGVEDDLVKRLSTNFYLEMLCQFLHGNFEIRYNCSVLRRLFFLFLLETELF